MDVQTLAKELTALLIPFLPWLTKLGDKAAEEAGQKLGTEAWEKVKAIWIKIKPKVETRPAIKEILEEAARTPDDADTQAALRLQIKKLLAEDAELTNALKPLLKEAQHARFSVVAKGDRSVAIGGSVSGSTIITGDSNIVKRD